MLNRKTSRLRTVFAFIASVALIGLSVWVFINRQYISDQLSVWQYSPSQSISSISERAQLTDHGKLVFYATTPEVSTGDTFNGQCPRREVASPILGCYTSHDRIFIFDIDNAELDGIEEVTAAHELLHAAWTRLGSAEKDRLSLHLQRAYESVQDSAMKQRMAYYQRTEPTEFANELHSILATEVSELAPELEAHYEKFFANRQAIVAMHDRYSKTFTALYTELDEAKQKISGLSDSIAQALSVYRASESALAGDIATFNQRATSGYFTTTTQFQNERSALLSRSAALERSRVAVNEQMSEYNMYASQYNELVQKLNGLNQSIDSYKVIEKGPSVQ